MLVVTSSLDSGAGTLRDAIAAASPGDIITFNGDMTITLTSELVISQSLTIDGETHAVTVGRDAGKIAEIPLLDHVAATSVGLVDGELLADLDYSEDSRAEVDFNVVATDAGTYVEVQGTAEGKPFQRQQMDRLMGLADAGLRQLFSAQQEALARVAAPSSGTARR